MNLVAFKILLHDKAKYVALVLGVSFATLLISQQSAIFHSLTHDPRVYSFADRVVHMEDGLISKVETVPTQKPPVDPHWASH